MKRYLLCSICLLTWAQIPNPIAQWSKPPPAQHLVTKDVSPPPTLPLEEESLSAPLPNNNAYEDIVVFALRASIAAFHVNPKTFMQDQSRLPLYYEPNALAQMTQALFPGSGTGLLDRCIVTQSICDGITRAPVIIEQEAPHFLQVRVPMVLDTKDTIDVILHISRQTPALRITSFSLEEVQ